MNKPCKLRPWIAGIQIGFSMGFFWPIAAIGLTGLIEGSAQKGSASRHPNSLKNDRGGPHPLQKTVFLYIFLNVNKEITSDILMIDWVFGFDQNPPSPEKLGTTRTRCRPRLSQIAARCPEDGAGF
jgi:hypothetical protein